MDETFNTFDPYKVLHLHRRAPPSLIAEAYWHLANQARRGTHPSHEREAILNELNRAYHILADAEQREAHDKQRATDDTSAPPKRRRFSLGRHTAKRHQPDYYEFLQVDPGAGADIVEIAFGVLSQQASAGSPARMRLEEARRVLTDPGLRAAYDASCRLSGSADAAESAHDTEVREEFLREFGKPSCSNAMPDAPSIEDAGVGPYTADAEPPNGDGSAFVTVPRRAPGTEDRPPAAPATVRRAEIVGRPEEGLARDILVSHSILPLRRQNGTLELAITRPEDAAVARELARAAGAEPRIYLEDRSVVQEGLVRLYHAEDQREVAWGHAGRCPQLSAQRVLTAPQKLTGLLLLTVVAAALYFFLMPTLVTLVALCTAFYLAYSGYKMFVVFKSLTWPGELTIDQSELDALDERTLPTYTLLLPLYREANVVESLLTGIEALDYPTDKLDVKLLLEADDSETIAAVDRASLPPYYHKLIVPSGGPKAKPKALNYGLLYARGEYCTIYDAEDRPEADQLKKAVIAFRKSSDRIGCIQAKLNFYNRDQNLLTKWFTADYSQWFDLYLPGLTADGAPIPLGGTSNHFPTTLLREIGGWDPFNVTEDADLGIRLARSGWKTAMIDSVTYEEANSRLGNWLRQRSHWIKGYMLTWLVHMRNPLRLWRELGTRGFLSIQITVAGSVFGYFANPVFWGLLAAWYIVGWGVIQSLYPTPVLYLATLALFVGNFAFVYVAMAGCLKREFYGGVKYALLIPLYWALMTIAAFHALYQLVTKPHYWEKTVHGLVPEDQAVRSAEVIA